MRGCLGIVATSGDVDIRVNETAIAAGMSFAVPIWMKGFVTAVAEVAEVECPVGEPDPLGRPRTGPHMRDSHVPRVVGMTGVVTADRPYALSVHNGARSHEIPLGGASAQKAKGYPLRFLKDGVVRRPWSVNHPGNVNPNPWLVRSLLIVGGRLPPA